MPGMTQKYARNSRSQFSIGNRVVLPIVRREFRKQPGARIVEVGCGPGTLLKELAQKLKVEPLGLDQDKLAVSLALEHGRRASRADFRRFPKIIKNRFGLAYSNEALHWTPQPPKRFIQTSWFYRFLPDQASFEKWGEARFVEGLRGVAGLLQPAGKAVLQFGGHGQLQELFKSFAWVLKDGRFKRYHGRLWYPVYYPKKRELTHMLKEAGLKPVEVRSWSEPLSEKSPAETTAFVRAFTERTFLRAMRAPDRELFYELLLERLRKTGLRRIRWQRTLIFAVKCSHEP